MSDGPFTIAEHTASDGYRWRYRSYATQGPRAHLVFVHGIQSHGGWYIHSCTRLAEAGFAVTFLDRRGAGLNELHRGDAPSFRRLIDDVAEFLHALRPMPWPIFLAGISWGAKVVTALERRHPGLTDGLLLLCPGYFPVVRPSFRDRLRIIWSRLIAPGRLFPIPLNDPELFTATPRWQEFLRDDPLRLHQATARLLIESVRLDGYLRFVPKYVRVPILVLLAEADRIIDNARTRRYLERFVSLDRQVIEYPGAHHTLEFEPDPEGFLGDMQHWLERHCPAPSPVSHS